MVSLSQHAELVIPCPVELVKVRLPPCQLGDVSRASSQRISQPLHPGCQEVDLRCSSGNGAVAPRQCCCHTAGCPAGSPAVSCALESPAAAGLHRSLLAARDAALPQQPHPADRQTDRQTTAALGATEMLSFARTWCGQEGSSGDLNGFSAEPHTNSPPAHLRDLVEALSSHDGFCWVFVAYRVGLSSLLWAGSLSKAHSSAQQHR